MKVELNITSDTLFAINDLLDKIYQLPVSLDKRENVYKSIGYDVADKISTRAKTQIKKANLFQNKKIKFTIKYHEAWALEEILKDLLSFFTPDNDYHQNLIQNLINQLNQKLA